MIILDTNVVSALMASKEDATVLAWVESFPPEALFTTAICEAEVFYGIACLDGGKRRDALEDVAARIFGEIFEGRVLAFGSSSARAYGAVRAVRRAAGRPVSMADAMIAAIAVDARMAIATRNVRDFEDCGAEVVNPWLDQVPGDDDPA